MEWGLALVSPRTDPHYMDQAPNNPAQAGPAGDRLHAVCAGTVSRRIAMSVFAMGAALAILLMAGGGAQVQTGGHDPALETVAATPAALRDG